MIKKAVKPVNFAALLSSGVWDDANVAKIDNFRKESSCHHPETTLRMLYNNDGIFGRFEVKDRYVRCVAEKFQCHPDQKAGGVSDRDGHLCRSSHADGDDKHCPGGPCRRDAGMCGILYYRHFPDALSRPAAEKHFLRSGCRPVCDFRFHHRMEQIRGAGGIRNLSCHGAVFCRAMDVFRPRHEIPCRQKHSCSAAVVKYTCGFRGLRRRWR